LNFEHVVKNISTLTDLKRSCVMYVIDYRNLDKSELEGALIKTSPQYYHKNNVEKALKQCFYHENRHVRILVPIIIKEILLNKRDFALSQKELNEEIIKFEQKIVNEANEDLIRKNNSKKEKYDLFYFILETAWLHENKVSPDEKNLILKLKDRLNITDREYMLLESKLGKFPKPNNQIHTNDEINRVRREMQQMGLIFAIRDENRTDYDIIPEELAKVYREIYDLEIKTNGYQEILKIKYVKKKSYLRSILEKGEIEFDNGSTLSELQELVVRHIKPSILLGGYSARDGLDVSDLSDWCRDLDLKTSGQKQCLIERIIEYYDGIYEKEEIEEDERACWFNYYEEFASRNLELLRKHGLINKDLDCERKFEDATDYIFENYLKQKPIQMIGSEHPDGMLSFGERLIFWDNKSKETLVDLKGHIKQFDRYIKTSKKPVVAFLVIAPDFTEQSVEEAMRYQLLEDTVITLVKAEDLKEIAMKWNENYSDEPFPLGYFKQPGIFNKNLIK